MINITGREPSSVEITGSCDWKASRTTLPNASCKVGNTKISELTRYLNFSFPYLAPNIDTCSDSPFSLIKSKISDKVLLFLCSPISLALKLRSEEHTSELQ